MPKFGVNVDEQLFEYLESQRIEYDDATAQTDIRARTEVARELLRLGRIANELIDNSELELERGRAREAFVRQAVLNELSREGVDDGR
jgi:hypothetical protein